MELSSHRNRSRRLRRGRVAAFLAVVAVLVILLLYVISPVRATLYSLVSPLWATRAAVSDAAAVSPGFFRTKVGLQTRLNEAQARLQETEAEMTRLQALAQENQHLKELLGRKTYQETVLASVLARPSVTPYDTLIIDAGEELIEVGDAVVAQGNIIIGTVSDVQASRAQVLLFSAPGIETHVLIGPARVPVTARGQGGGSFIVQFPREVDIDEGYAVVMPGINPYVFATVDSVSSSSADSFVEVRFRNPVNLQSLIWVEVLTDLNELPTDVTFTSATSTEIGDAATSTTISP